MSAKEIRKLRLAAGVADDEPSNPVDMIDARTLPGGRILFVTAAGSGHCLHVKVFHHGRGFEELWSESEMPGGAGFCHPSLCRDAKTWATRKNQVIVAVPVNLEGAPMGVCDESVLLTYKGAGKTYVLAETKHLAAQCGLDDYQRALHMAFAEPEGSASPSLDRLVTVHFFPSFRPESAIAFEKTSNGLAISRLSFSQQAWEKLAVFTRRQTPSQCIAAAKAIPIQRTQVNISQGDVQRLLDDLKKIDLQTDSCPRSPDGSCARIFDGETITIILEDGRLLGLTNVNGVKGVRSENPALSHWVKSLRDFVKIREVKPNN